MGKKTKQKTPPKASREEKPTAPAISSEDKKLAFELNAHHKYFDDLVNRIPAHLYITSKDDDDEDLYAPNTKYYKNQHKESKESKNARLKFERSVKYEHTPDSKMSTVDMQRRDGGDVRVPPMRDRRADADVDDDKDGIPSENVEEEVDADGKSRIEILREKLHVRIAAKQGYASVGLVAALNNADKKVSKRAARKAEKLRRIEAGKQRNANNSVGDEKGKQRNSKNSGGVEKGKQRNSNNLGGAPSKHVSQTKIEISDVAPASNFENSESELIKDDQTLSRIDYGNLTGLDGGKKDWMSANKSLRNQGRKKSLEKMMEEAEKKKKRLDDLKSKAGQGDEEAREEATKILWSDTLQSATGEMVHKKNDPALIKKAIKRKQKQKEKSAAKWANRLDTKAEKMHEKQSIRNHNISQRRAGGSAGANLSKKRIQDKEGKEVTKGEQAQKKRRLGPHAMKNRPGFEGKTTDFLNKD